MGNSALVKPDSFPGCLASKGFFEKKNEKGILGKKKGYYPFENEKSVFSRKIIPPDS